MMSKYRYDLQGLPQREDNHLHWGKGNSHFFPKQLRTHDQVQINTDAQGRKASS